MLSYHSHALSALQYCTAQQALCTPVAATAAWTAALLSVALELQTKQHEAQSEGLSGLHKLWLCRNFDVLWNGSWVRTAGKEEVHKITVFCASSCKITDLTWAEITVWRMSVLPHVERVMSNAPHFSPVYPQVVLSGLTFNFTVIIKLVIFDNSVFSWWHWRMHALKHTFSVHPNSLLGSFNTAADSLSWGCIPVQI